MRNVAVVPLADERVRRGAAQRTADRKGATRCQSRLLQQSGGRPAVRRRKAARHTALEAVAAAVRAARRALGRDWRGAAAVGTHGCACAQLAALVGRPLGALPKGVWLEHTLMHSWMQKKKKKKKKKKKN